LRRDDVHVLNQPKHPGDLSDLLIGKSIDKLLNRTGAIGPFEKQDFPHLPHKLTCALTLSRPGFQNFRPNTSGSSLPGDNRPGLRYEVDRSLDLNQWTPIAEAIDGPAFTPLAGQPVLDILRIGEVVRITIDPAAPGPGFFRLRVSRY
jgi:hypothetical protein